MVGVPLRSCCKQRRESFLYREQKTHLKNTHSLMRWSECWTPHSCILHHLLHEHTFSTVNIGITFNSSNIFLPIITSSFGSFIVDFFILAIFFKLIYSRWLSSEPFTPSDFLMTSLWINFAPSCCHNCTNLCSTYYNSTWILVSTTIAPTASMNNCVQRSLTFDLFALPLNTETEKAMNKIAWILSDFDSWIKMWQTKF